MVNDKKNMSEELIQPIRQLQTTIATMREITNKFESFKYHPSVTFHLQGRLLESLWWLEQLKYNEDNKINVNS